MPRTIAPTKVTLPPFYLMLRYLAVDMDIRRSQPEAGEKLDGRAWYANAIRPLNRDQKLELIRFVDQHLASDGDDETLARVFDDGHAYRVWHAPGGPRLLLTLIRDIAQTQI